MDFLKPCVYDMNKKEYVANALYVFVYIHFRLSFVVLSICVFVKLF